MLNFLIMTFNLSKRKDGAMPSCGLVICISWPIIHTRKLWKFSFHPHLIFRKKCHKRIYTSSITFAAPFWYQEFNSGFATLLQNELNSDVARFTIHVQNRKMVARFLRVVKTGNIAIQLVLQQCYLYCTGQQFIAIDIFWCWINYILLSATNIF